MRRVLVTRPQEQAAEVCALLASAGLEGVVVPLVRTEPAGGDDGRTDGGLDAALGRIREYGWVVFSSATAARVVVERMHALGLRAEDWNGVQIVAGPATARALAEQGLTTTRVVAPFSARAALEALAVEPLEGVRVLLPRAEGGREELGEGLRERGAMVDEVVAYRTVPVRESAALAGELERGVDAVLFFSPSAVQGFASAMRASGIREDQALSGAVVACIGVTTAGEAQRLGLPVDVIAPDTTAAALVSALADRLAAPARAAAGIRGLA